MYNSYLFNLITILRRTLDFCRGYNYTKPTFDEMIDSSLCYASSELLCVFMGITRTIALYLLPKLLMQQSHRTHAPTPTQTEKQAYMVR